MSTATLTPVASTRVTPRWLLLGSLALNLFFVGIAIAMAVRAPAPPSWDRNVFVRVERLAATLPPADAASLRAAIDANRENLEAAQTQYHKAQDVIRAALRQDPFQLDGMRAAMTKSRAARQNFDQILQGTFADAASKMSHAGRLAMADWPPGRKSASKP